jgi:hypothetical protein
LTTLRIIGRRYPSLNAPVAQLDRAPGFEPVGRRFESCRARLNYILGPVAQLAEQLTLNQLVGGSNPLRPTRYIKGLAEYWLNPF